MKPSGEPIVPMPGHPLTSRKSASPVVWRRRASSTPSSSVWPAGAIHAALMRTPTANGGGQARRTAAEDLEHEPRPVRERAAVPVAAVVAPRREPDAEEVRVRGVDLDAVHPRRVRDTRRGDVSVDERGDVGGVHLLAHLAVSLRLAGRERARTPRRVPAVGPAVRLLGSVLVELHEHLRPVLVARRGDAREACAGGVVVRRRPLRTRLRVDLGLAHDDQAEAAGRPRAAW